MWRFVSRIIFLLEEGEQLSIFSCVLLFIKKLRKKLVMVTMVFTSTIRYTMVPQLLAPHLITSLFVRQAQKRLEPLQLNLSA